ncbi:MAG TPA: GNAT family N-acetyltransferase [Acidimicrobiales bacterium]
MRIRRAGPDDAVAIATVYVRSWKGAYPGLIPQPYLDALTANERVDPWRATLAASVWPHTGTIVLLGPAGDAGAGEGPITGFVSFSSTRDTDLEAPSDDAGRHTVGEILTFYLDPSAFGSGGADLLMSAAFVALRGAHFATAMLWVLSTNTRARRFYERRGWRPDGTSKLHDWDAFVATDLRYVIDLASVAPEPT